MMGGSASAAVALVAAATLGGARVAYAFRGARRRVLTVAAAALLAVVTFDLIPDIIRDVADVGSGRRLVGAGCLAAFAGAVVVAGRVCACARHPTTMTGVAISLHRALEGAALAWLSSAGIVAALAAHAAGEGFALQAFGAHRVRQLLVLACISPATGAAAFGGTELPGNAAPIVTALIAGTLITAAVRMIASVRSPAPA